MSSSRVIEEEDLIDLEEEAGKIGCVSRSSTSLPEASAEELEHLLDVCPPQLEQKLSLTREQESLPDERTESNDVLVELGHDKLVPRRKRIDVVSCETIKRIRDITRNLEPVMSSCENVGRFEEPAMSNDHVDAGDVTGNDPGARSSIQDTGTKSLRQDFAYETQAINSAFDFLTELEDDEDQPPDKKRRRNASREDEDETPSFSYPLEPTCLVQDSTNCYHHHHHHHRQHHHRHHRRRYRDVDRANREIGADDESLVIDRSSDDDEQLRNVHLPDENHHENPAFDPSPNSKTNHYENHRSTHDESTSERTGVIVLANDDHSFNDGDERDKRVEDRAGRKSWSERETHATKDGKDAKNFEGSTSSDFERFCEPSTSNGITSLLRTSSRCIFRQGAPYSASSSECSEVDWSWVEEYESRNGHQRSRSRDSRIHDSGNDHKSMASDLSCGARDECTSTSDCRGVASFSPLGRRSAKGYGAGGGYEDEASAGAICGTGSGDRRKQRARAGCKLVDGQSIGGSASVAMSRVGTGKSTAREFRSTSTIVPSAHDICPETSGESFDRTEYETTSDSRRDSDHRFANENSRISGSFGQVAACQEHDGSEATNLDLAVRDDDPRGSRNTSGNSWLRASMRRIRHLRLPETNPRRDRVNDFTRIVNESLVNSGPNSLPDIALVAPEVLAAHTNATNAGARPSSAPSIADRSHNETTTPRRGRRHAARNERLNNAITDDRIDTRIEVNELIRVENADISSQTNVGVATGTQARRANGATTNQRPGSTNGARRICERQRVSDRDNERGDDDDEDENPLGRWPHPLSPALACLGCTLGLFNISRFAILSIQFGANFIVQFLVLSLILGIPLLTLQVCLGQRLAAGAVDMWRISPIFHGVGIALLVAQAFIGIYSIIGVSWMFVYFRDSFITKQDRYRWAEPFSLYREDARILQNTTDYKLAETVPDYFSGVVLQRHHLNEPDPGVVTLKFQVAFNLAVVWMIVFVSLSKGLRSYGKVVYVFTLVPVFGTLVLCTKLLSLTPPGSIHQLFPATVWSEFFINSKSWVAASSEVFLTWGLFGAAAMQVAAHNKHKHLLQRDTSLVVVLTLVVLLLAAFLANTCVQILRHYGYSYVTNSFEIISGYTFMRHVNQPAPSGYSNTPERFMSHASFLLGQRVIRPGADLGAESGYQALRFSTELVPATLAILGTEQVSPFWAVLFYFILILFGIAQQLAIWHCVITGIMAINAKMMKLWETTITFFSCACAYILGLPMATELGIYVVYYLDYTVGGAWWIMILYLVEVGAVFAVRGRPHTGETVVAELFPPTGRCLRHWAGPLLSFTWNVILPVALMVLSITVFKSCNFRDLYVYRRTSRDYWSVWARQLGAAIQLTPILIIPGVAIIQTCRYLNSGPPDIFDTEDVEISCSHCEQCNANRIQLLYRPPLDTNETTNAAINYGNETSTSIHGNGILPTQNEPPFEDPPPKYTPPPSYTTATGARIAKMLRQSFRRSVRRIASLVGETSTPRTRPALQPPPPDYATVLVEMNQSVLTNDRTIRETRPDVTDTRSFTERNYHDRNRPRTIDRMTRISTIDRSSIERTHSTMDRGRTRFYNTGSSNLTAADVANLLRSSMRRGAIRGPMNLCVTSSNDNRPMANTLLDAVTTTTAASVENLVNAAVPINEDVCDKDVPLVHDNERENHEDDEKKTVNGADDSVSVI